MDFISAVISYQNKVITADAVMCHFLSFHSDLLIPGNHQSVELISHNRTCFIFTQFDQNS